MMPITFFFLLLTGCILTHSRLSFQYAALGLELWSQKMVPSLLPFMILSGIMVRMNLTEKIALSVYPAVKPIYRVRKNVCYCMLLGFLCGFPMGARVTADLLEQEKITPREAEYLLAFCNNIGPVYFLSYALPLLGRSLTFPYLFGMYGIPLLYGLFLRGTFYQDLPRPSASRRALGKRSAARLHICSKEPVRRRGQQGLSAPASLPEALEEAIRSSGISILTLGGYMILFNLLNLVPHVLFGKPLAVLAPLLEITGGLGMLQGSLPLYSLLALSFGGLSCLFQTYSCIRGTGLSLRAYLFHKAFLTFVTGAFYLSWVLLSPATFLK